MPSYSFGLQTDSTTTLLHALHICDESLMSILSSEEFTASVVKVSNLNGERKCSGHLSRSSFRLGVGVCG